METVCAIQTLMLSPSVFWTMLVVWTRNGDKKKLRKFEYKPCLSTQNNEIIFSFGNEMQ